MRPRVTGTTVTLTLCTVLRRRFGRGAGVEARIFTLHAVDDITVDADLVRAETLRRLRAERLRFGPETWCGPGDVREIALVASEHGDARRDVEHVLGPLEAAGVLRVHRVVMSSIIRRRSGKMASEIMGGSRLG